MTRQRPNDLHAEQDPAFERREWTVERIGWTLLALLLIAALLGLCGSAGPFGRAAVGEEGGPIRLRYARFPRHAAPTSLDIQLGPSATQTGSARVWIDRTFLERFAVEHVLPEPEEVEVDEQRLIYVIPIAEPGSSASVSFHLRAEGYGPQTGRAGLDGGPSHRVRQFVYP